MKKSLLLVPALLSLMVACGGGGSEDEVNNFTSSTGSGSNSSASCNSRYSDTLSATTRKNATADAQCSSYVALADSYLEKAKATCAAGSTSDADAIYKQYQSSASYATSAVATVCGGATTAGTGSGSSSSTTGYYSLYIKYSRTTKNVLGGLCSTGGAPSDDTGYYWYTAANNLTQAQCKTKAESYGLTMG